MPALVSIESYAMSDVLIVDGARTPMGGLLGDIQKGKALKKVGPPPERGPAGKVVAGSGGGGGARAPSGGGGVAGQLSAMMAGGGSDAAS